MSTKTTDFKKRLQRVKQEVQTRVERSTENNKNRLRAHLWVKWINKNLLDNQEMQP